MSDQPDQQPSQTIENAENVEQTFEAPSGQGSTGPVEGTNDGGGEEPDATGS